jgi:hypothetical protein
VVLVGPSGRGKTTAARILGHHFGYLSDESVGIAPDGSVVPYRKPLSIIEEAGTTKAERAASDIGLMPLPDVPLRLAAVVLLDRQEDGPERPRVEELDFGDAVEDVVSQSSFLPDMASPLLTIAHHIAATGGVVRVTYRDVQALRPLIDSLASRSPVSAPSRPDLSAADGSERQGSATVSRAPFLDALGLPDPDRVVVLNGTGTQSKVSVLAGVAPAVWRAASESSMAALVDSAVAAYGVPDEVDAHAVVAGAVTELIGAGVLTRAEP